MTTEVPGFTTDPIQLHSMIADSHRQIKTQVFSVESWPDVAPIWSALVQASNCSFFLTVPWTELWLNVFGAQAKPRILIFQAECGPVGSCLISRGAGGMAGLGVRRVHLNAAGESPKETTFIEFNDILCDPEWAQEVAEALVEYLKQQSWDEVRLDGLQEGPVRHALAAGLGNYEPAVRCHPSYHVDLAALRKSGVSYESVLASNTRKHLRQNIRYHSELGPLCLTEAATAEEALRLFEELGVLSQKRSEALGRNGVFASSRFCRFHRELITRCFSQGNVQLLRLSAGDETVGITYNLVHRGKVYFYQCGYRYSSDKRLSPGTVTLSYAIQHCLDAGFTDFDFLSGEAKYKQSLSTGARELFWMTYRRPGLRMRVLEGLRWLKHQIANRKAAAQCVL